MMMSVSSPLTVTSAVGPFLSRSRRRSTTAVRSSTVSVGPTRLLTKLKHECDTPLPLLQQVADTMSSQMRAGLSSDGGLGLPMIPTFVHRVCFSLSFLAYYDHRSTLFNFHNDPQFYCYYDIGMKKDCSMHWILVEQIFVC
jgi:hypothetical protein